ncbi:hypothetical protein [Marilutibacter spongiae]|uniref:Uncharacterized protein n=1 Tax=Marilutibacter spongiae TaxID=2025720 RepID=A0A7W3TKJ3_9GAMM|nr:hypothetical protein [Lysobacter spongiae]MBB1060037.1 hypothetical protein [Lysobacter spongiae]
MSWLTMPQAVTVTVPARGPVEQKTEERSMVSRLGTCLLAASLLLAASCDQKADAGGGDAAMAAPSATTDMPPPSADAFKAFIDELRAFTGAAVMPVGALDGAPAPAVGDRIVAGFEQDPPRQAKLGDGTLVYWGWQEGQAFVKSIAIREPGGNLALVGAVDDLPVLAGRGTQAPIADAQAYQTLLDKQKGWGSEPAIRLFVKEPAMLERYLPQVRAWARASMLGFNVDCGAGDMQAACEFARSLDLPITAYSLECPGTLDSCALELPTATDSDTSLEVFRQ